MKNNHLKCAVSIITLVVMIFALLPAFGVSADDSKQDQAVAWANEQIGKSIDYDGSYGAQCVDLIQAYYDLFGYRNYSGGNAIDFATKSLPSGWTRIKYGSIKDAKPGDIAVWKANNKYYTSPGWWESTGVYGHIGIIVDVSSTELTIVHQNHLGSGKVQKSTYSTSCCSEMLSCLIRPVFSTFSYSGNLTKTPVSIDYISEWHELTSYITKTDAMFIHRYKINSGYSMNSLQKVGIELWDSKGKLIGSKEETPDRGDPTYVYAYYKINEELKLTLSPGTAYSYRFYCIYNGSKYYGTTYSFTTLPNESVNEDNAKQNRAVAWANEQIGKSIDYDGLNSAQCVDLIQAYYDLFGYRNYSDGNAIDFATKSLPSGWTRIKYASINDAKPGDIAVWKANNKYYTSPGWWESTGEYGHIGIIVDVSSTGLTVVHQNHLNSGKVQKSTYSTSCCSEMLSCLIRPNYSTFSYNHTHALTKISAIAATCRRMAISNITPVPAAEKSSVMQRVLKKLPKKQL